MGKQKTRGIGNPLRLRPAHAIPDGEGLDGRVAQVVMMVAAQQVVEHAQAQCALGENHFFQAKCFQYGNHDGQAAGQHRQPIRLDTGQRQGIETARLDQRRAQLLQPRQGYAPVGVAVAAQDVAERLGSAAGAHRQFPTHFCKPRDNGLQLALSGQIGLLKTTSIEFAIGEIAQAETDTAHVQGLEFQRLERPADDELR